MKTETFKYSVVPLKGLLTNHARKFLTEEEEVEDGIQETYFYMDIQVLKSVYCSIFERLWN